MYDTGKKFITMVEGAGSRGRGVFNLVVIAVAIGELGMGIGNMNRCNADPGIPVYLAGLSVQLYIS